MRAVVVLFVVSMAVPASDARPALVEPLTAELDGETDESTRVEDEAALPVCGTVEVVDIGDVDIGGMAASGEVLPGRAVAPTCGTPEVAPMPGMGCAPAPVPDPALAPAPTDVPVPVAPAAPDWAMAGDAASATRMIRVDFMERSENMRLGRRAGGGA